MSDIVELKLNDIAADVKEIKTDVETLENTYDSLSGCVDRLSRWALDGNGSSAETRLKSVESDMSDMKKCFERVASDEHIGYIASSAAKSVIDNAKTRDKTMISKVRAFAPYFAAACAVIGSILVAILK